ncbi:MAG TPA: hypothetical protein PK659_10395 [Methanothrix sp.]|nr:hypothetical protein [Methanothrix sp.]HOK59196.1 hypothetical protein [Methanothrix sp.]HOL44652.1 hypothetical protein [Methanothrix sp.]HPO89429.1 hypothetical protein [Methanothrix sp.]
MSKTSVKRLQDPVADRIVRMYTPVPTLLEDTATIDGLIDLLIVKGVIHGEGTPGEPGYVPPERVVMNYIDRYGSAVNGLCMLLYEKGIVTEDEHRIAIGVYHDAIRHFGTRACTFDEVQSFRKNLLRKRLEEAKK